MSFNSKSSDFPIQQIKGIMKKLMTYKQNMEFPELNKLFYLLTETLLGVASRHNQTARSKNSVAERVQNKIVKLVPTSHSIQPISTFDQTTTDEYYARLDEMNKLRRAHTHVYKKLQRQQKICWVTDRKVQKYEACLKKIELPRYFNADKLSRSKLKVRNDRINYLQTIINQKQEKAAETARRFQTLMTKEQTTRNALRLLERELLDDIRFNLVERIQSGLVCLKYILATQTNKFYEVLPHIDNFDCQLAVESIIEKLSSTYQFSLPQEFRTAKTKIPDVQFVSHKTAKQKIKKQLSETLQEAKKERNDNNINFQNNQLNVLCNYYVKTKDLSEKTNESFVKTTKGMIIKLKVTIDESEVAFGWYKTNPWSQKRWGFFCKSSENKIKT
ncbi:Hypothetical predicted protein [Mytilus galloprovincialis]|uniref:Uncharacterized protein n=1 Tax=Mytilus galloprovincialis TaxID=29158 RepID=A0A8B6BJI3_MYTGA|nr:Hypothetical predicted protein [Mytilus galloprovincialis]